MKNVIFCWVTEITLFLHSPKGTPRHECGQKPSHLRSHSRRRKMMMIYFKWRMSSFAESLKSLYPFISPNQPHVTNLDKNLATWGRIQGDERWWWSTSNEECHLLLTQWSRFFHELSWIRKWDQWLLKLLEKSLFFLQNTLAYRNTGQRARPSLRLPLHQTHSDQNLHMQHLQFSLTAELQYQTSVPQPCQV